MRNFKEHNNSYLKILGGGIALLAVGAVIAVAAYGTFWKGDTEDSGHASAVEVTHKAGHGLELAEEANGHDGGHQDAVVTHERGVEAGEVLEITLDAEEWRFAPLVLEMPVGHRVKLTLVNNGVVEHDVELVGVPAEDIEVVGAVEHERLGGGHHDEGVVAAHAEPGTTATVIFTATEVGEFEFVCTIPGHKEAGMVGKIVVTE